MGCGVGEIWPPIISIVNAGPRKAAKMFKQPCILNINVCMITRMAIMLPKRLTVDTACNGKNLNQS